MSDDTVQAVKAQVDDVVSAKMDELREHISEKLTCCAKETSVRDESDGLKALMRELG